MPPSSRKKTKEIISVGKILSRLLPTFRRNIPPVYPEKSKSLPTLRRYMLPPSSG
jgi:hypothetical protein